MSWPELFLLALALAADAASVGAAVGLEPRGLRATLRMSFHFGLFQAVMPLLGALGGRALSWVVGRSVHWLAGAVLAVLGGKFVWDAGWGRRAESGPGADPTRGLPLVGLSVAVSLDALAAGLVLGLSRLPLLAAVGVIGGVTFLATALAMGLAARVGQLFGRWTSLAGGLVLVGLGLAAFFK